MSSRKVGAKMSTRGESIDKNIESKMDKAIAVCRRLLY